MTTKIQNLPATNKNAPIEIDFNDYKHIRVTNSRLMVKEIKINYSENHLGIITSSKQVRQSFTQGVVVKVGDGYINNDGILVPPDFQLGDVVFFSDMGGTEFKLLRNESFEDVRVLDVASVYYVDGLASRLYKNVTDAGS